MKTEEDDTSTRGGVASDIESIREAVAFMLTSLDDDDRQEELQADEDMSEVEEGKQDDARLDEIDDLLIGMMFATLSATDDEPDYLKEKAHSEPWHLQALKMVTGSETEAYLPVSEILDKHMDLKLDYSFALSGISKGGFELDVKGFIAHNEQVVVMSYNTEKSGFEWMSSINKTTASWEVDDDHVVQMALGFTGLFSKHDNLRCGEGPKCMSSAPVRCDADESEPWVHEGFFNNFLATLPSIKQYIAPLLGEDQPPRTFYLVGHSVGGGIATMAACYFLLEYDWNKLPQSFFFLTAGGPRTCGLGMQEVVYERVLSMKDSVKLHRLVNAQDMMPTLPPALWGYRHLIQATLILDDGSMRVPNLLDRQHDGDMRLKEIMGGGFDKPVDIASKTTEASYGSLIGRFPPALREHMPDAYLKSLYAARVHHIKNMTTVKSHLRRMALFDDLNTVDGLTVTDDNAIPQNGLALLVEKAQSDSNVTTIEFGQETDLQDEESEILDSAREEGRQLNISPVCGGAHFCGTSEVEVAVKEELPLENPEPNNPTNVWGATEINLPVEEPNHLEKSIVNSHWDSATATIKKMVGWTGLPQCDIVEAVDSASMMVVSQFIKVKPDHLLRFVRETKSETPDETSGTIPKKVPVLTNDASMLDANPSIEEVESHANLSIEAIESQWDRMPTPVVQLGESEHQSKRSESFSQGEEDHEDVRDDEDRDTVSAGKLIPSNGSSLSTRTHIQDDEEDSDTSSIRGRKNYKHGRPVVVVLHSSQRSSRMSTTGTTTVSEYE